MRYIGNIDPYRGNKDPFISAIPINFKSRAFTEQLTRGLSNFPGRITHQGNENSFQFVWIVVRDRFIDSF